MRTYGCLCVRGAANVFGSGKIEEPAISQPPFRESRQGVRRTRTTAGSFRICFLRPRCSAFGNEVAAAVRVARADVSLVVATALSQSRPACREIDTRGIGPRQLRLRECGVGVAADGLLVMRGNPPSAERGPNERAPTSSERVSLPSPRPDKARVIPPGDCAGGLLRTRSWLMNWRCSDAVFEADFRSFRVP
jgi:hypothetical protein